MAKKVSGVVKLTPLGGSQNEGLFRSESGIIYFRKFREGKGEIFKSCKTDKPSEARERRDEFMAELWGEKKKEKARRQTVGEMWDVWYAGLAETKRPKTAESIRTAWKNLGPYIETSFLDDMTVDWWLTKYIPQKRAEQNPRKGIDNSKRKFFNEWKWLSGFLKYCEEQGKGDPDWTRPRLINPDSGESKARVYAKEEMAALYQNATLKMTAFLVAGEEHFMRRSEIKNLSWDRVDMEARTIRLRKEDTKIKKPRTFPFNQKLYDLFQEIRAEAKALGVESPFVFPSLVGESPGTRPMTFSEFRTMWEACRSKAGLPAGSRFHWLRHTGLTKAFRRGRLDAALICHFAGLSLDEADKTYLHFTPQDLIGVENLVGEDL